MMDSSIRGVSLRILQYLALSQLLVWFSMRPICQALLLDLGWLGYFYLR